MSVFGKFARKALEEQKERALLGLKARPRRLKAVPRRKKPPLYLVDATHCQRCGALRITNKDGKLPPHRCDK